MPCVSSVLVLGSGPAGTAAAVLLAGAGVAVDVVEVRPFAAISGSGITLQGNALRVLEQLGVYDEASRLGFGFDDLALRAPDPQGTLLVELPDLRTGGAHLPATMGMLRADLSRLLVDRAEQAGAKLRFGTTVVTLNEDEHGVEALFSDGSSGRYDLVVGADGVHSQTRELLGTTVTPTALGMGIWRVVTPRPDSVFRTELIHGGANFIAGYCPTSPDTLYAYVVEPIVDRGPLTPDQRLDVMRELTAPYHGPWDEIGALLAEAGRVDPASVNYTVFETHLLPAPWGAGRAVLIGDAAHSCPPTLAQGAAMALEDAAVLAELLITGDRVDAALWDAFADRRTERVRTVVDSSVQMCRWLLAHEQGDMPGLMATVTGLVAQPA